MELLGSDLVQQTPLHAAHVLYGLPQPQHGLSLAAANLLKKFRKVFPFPGTPKHLVSQSSPGIEVPDSQSVVLALKTLGSFDFEGHSLLQFVRHCADTYLHSEEKEIRLEAVRTCSSLLRSALLGAAGKKSPTVMSTINEVLAKLLIVGITDTEPDVRFSSWTASTTASTSTWPRPRTSAPSSSP